MDADGGLTLNGSQQDELIEALMEAFGSHAEFEMLLALQLDRSFDAIVGEGRLKLCVFRLVQAAMGGGWLPDLVNAAVHERPGNVRLRNWTQGVGHVIEAPGISIRQALPLPQQLSLTVYFDLDELRKSVARATSELTGQVLGFAVTYPDSVYIGKLSDWLGSYLETERKEPLNLLPELGPVSGRLRAVERYRRDLESANVLCVVYADSAPAEAIAEFWQGVRQSFDEVGHRLVLVFACHAGASLPPEIVALPSPQFEVADIALWTHQIIRIRGWPAELAHAWTELLREESQYDNILDVRGLYEAMDRSLQELQFTPEPFRRKLEERRGHGDQAQARYLAAIRQPPGSAGQKGGGGRRPRSRSRP